MNIGNIARLCDLWAIQWRVFGGLEMALEIAALKNIQPYRKATMCAGTVMERYPFLSQKSKIIHTPNITLTLDGSNT